MELDGDALFFADSPVVTTLTSASGEPRSAYGEHRRPNWPSILAILLAHVALFYALVTFDVVHIAAKKKPLVVELIAEPPAPPAEKPEPQPVVVEKVQPVVIAPPPIIQTIAPPPPAISVTSVPPPPKPVAAPAPPAGPVAVEDLNERLLEGQPPRVPFEARRKKQGGTVLLRLVIGTNGHVDQISVAQTSGLDSLDQAALQAVRRWVWKPLIRDGAAVAMRATLPITFNITA